MNQSLITMNQLLKLIIDNNEQEEIKIRSCNESIIKINQSIIDNNKSMMEINQSIIDNKESIIEINQSIIDNNESIIEINHW